MGVAQRPKASRCGLPISTEAPGVIIWNYLYLSSQYFVSNVFISILSYFSHQGPRDPQTFSINRW